MAQTGQTVEVRDRRDRRDQRQEGNPLAQSVAGLAGLLWAATFGVVKLVGMGVWAALMAFVWLGRASLVGRHRHRIAPLWVAFAAVLSAWAGGPGVGWYWLTVAVAVEASTWRRASKRAAPWRVLSERERRLVAMTLALAAAALDLAPWLGLPWTWASAAAATAILGGSVPWWRWRGARGKRPAILDRWDDEVVAKDERFAGDWVDFDEHAGTGVLELVNAPASTVAALDEHAEWLLNQGAGTVTITNAPPMTRRQVRVTFSQPGDAARFRFWEGPTLGKDGRFIAAYAAGNVPIYGRLWTPDGASFMAIIAPPGSGKGSIQRLLILETALHPDIFTIGIDGKRGKGLGYCRDGFDLFADTPKRWAEALDMSIAETERRSALPDGADSFVLRPGLPRTFTAIDDMPEVIAACPSAAKQLNRMSAQDRSLGKGLAVAAQKNDAPSYGGATYGTTTRSNILDNGWLWAGPATDSQARQALKQSFTFDPSTLPPAKGWAALMGKHLGEQAVMPSRTLWIPNRTDVAEHGMPSPFGTVEDWLERDTMHPVISDEMRAIFFPRAADAEPVPAEQEAVYTIVGDDGKGGDAVALIDQPGFDRLAMELVSQPDDPGGISMETARTMMLSSGAITPMTDAAGDGKSRVLAVLRANPDGLLRGPLADKAGLSPKHTSDTLKKLSQEGRVVQSVGHVWRVAS